MKTNLFNAKHSGRFGPGGWKCGCCGPAPKHRKKEVKRHKLFINKILDKFYLD